MCIYIYIYIYIVLEDPRLALVREALHDREGLEELVQDGVREVEHELLAASPRRRAK